MIKNELRKMPSGRIIGSQICEVECDKCKNILTRKWRNVTTSRKLYENIDLCQSCSRKLLFQQGKIVSQLGRGHPSHIKGLNFVQIYGEKRAAEIKARRGHVHYGGSWADYNKKQIGKTYEERFGEEKAADMKQRCSERNKGERNGMYGKPSPVGSGNGWSGWYQERYFRSLLELSFMVQFPAAVSAASIRIKYVDYDNKEKTYSPDFLLDDKIIEVKPKKLLGSASNLQKFQAARDLLGDKFIVMTDRDINRLDKDKIKELVDLGRVRFIERYKKKYEEMLKAEASEEASRLMETIRDDC